MEEVHVTAVEEAQVGLSMQADTGFQITQSLFQLAREARVHRAERAHHLEPWVMTQPFLGRDGA